MQSAPRLRAASLMVAALVMTSCAVRTDATGWDDPRAKTHFVDACTTDTEVVREGGESRVVERELASERFCTCVFEDLKSKHKIAWDDLLEFEERLADAEVGGVDGIPSQVNKALDACQDSAGTGPVAPSSN